MRKVQSYKVLLPRNKLLQEICKYDWFYAIQMLNGWVTSVTANQPFLDFFCRKTTAISP